jgi:hypothetical protein
MRKLSPNIAERNSQTLQRATESAARSTFPQTYWLRYAVLNVHVRKVTS